MVVARQVGNYLRLPVATLKGVGQQIGYDERAREGTLRGLPDQTYFIEGCSQKLQKSAALCGPPSLWHARPVSRIARSSCSQNVFTSHAALRGGNGR